MARVLLFAVVFGLVACGGGSGTESAGTGQLRVLLSDSPVDGADELWVKFTRVEARRGDTWEVISRGEREFDLLTLQNENTAVLADRFLPVGTYTELRIFIAPGGGSPIGGPGFRSPNRIVIDGESYPLKVPSGEKSGLKLKGEFEIKRDTLTLLLLDFNVRTSVVERGDRDEFLLRPRLDMFGVQISGSITGDVTAKSDGSAIGGVTISAQQQGDEMLSTRTLSDGTYKLIPLREGLYDLVASKSGYAPAVLKDVGVRREQNTPDKDFVLAAAESGKISGTAPFGDQYTVLLRWNGYFLAQTTADDNGDYSFTDVPVGTYSVELADGNVVVDDITGIEVKADTDSSGNDLSLP